MIEDKQTNVTMLFEEASISEFIADKISEIRRIFLEVSEAAPIINQFPDFVSVIDPAAQINVVAHDRKIVISDQQVNPFESRNIEKFLNIVKKIDAKIERRFKVYGFNFVFWVNLQDNIPAIEKIKNWIPRGIIAEEEVLLGGGLNFAYQKSDIRRLIDGDPVYDDTFTNLRGVSFACNSQFNNQTLPELNELISSFNAEHIEFKKKIEGLLE